MTGDKTRYFEFCQTVYVPLAFQPWWLDAVCGPDRWQVALAADKGENITGAMPYYLTRRWGLPVVQMPPFTAYAGPVFRYPQQRGFRESGRQTFEHKVLAELIPQLPRTAFFVQHFHPGISDWLPFYWAGFRQTTRYTYTLPDTSDLEIIYAGLKNTVRTDLKTAARYIAVEQTNDPALLFQLNTLSFARKGLRQSYSFSVFERLYGALAERGHSLGFVARDLQTGAPHAGLYLAFDGQQASVLLAGFDPALGIQSRALHALYWEAIRFCSERGLGLDFEGSMERGIEHVFRAFGGQRVPYMRVWRAGNRVARAVEALLR